MRACVYISFSLLPVVASDVVDPEGVADVLLALVLVFAEAREDVNLIELGVDCGSLGEARHRYCGGEEQQQIMFNSEIKTLTPPADVIQLR